MKKTYVVLFCFSLCLSVGWLNSETKKAEDVFGKWLKWQIAFDPINVATFADDLDGYIKTVYKKYNSNEKYLNIVSSVLSSFDDEKKKDKSVYFSKPLDEKLKKKFAGLYHALEYDIFEFIKLLGKLGFVSEAVNKQEEDLFANDKNRKLVVEKYKLFMRLLFVHDDERVTDRYLFSVANNIFRFCFGSTNFKELRFLLNNKKCYPIVRLLYVAIWYYLAGIGWRVWNRDVLDELKKFTDEGKNITYIAGGCDVYQMIKHGIYNITIIDPQLPTQTKFYSEGWEWFVRGNDKDGGIGDEIDYDFKDKKLKMKRIKYDRTEVLKIKLNDEKMHNIPSGKTVWAIYDETPVPTFFSKSFFVYWWKRLIRFGRPLGFVTLDRRLCNQSDFVCTKDVVNLISFNELYFLSQESWGIDSRMFDNNFKIYVKQFSEPVSKIEICNMKEAYLKDFRFLQLGSCVL